MSACLRIEGRRIDQKSTATPFSDDEPIIRLEDSIRGSVILRDAILRAKGYLSPIPERRPVPTLRPAPVFRPRARKRGRPKGSRNGWRKPRRDHPKIEQIKALVAAHFKITVERLMEPNKGHEVSHPRQIAMYLARKTTAASYPDIGHQFGGRDHTTVLHAFRAVERRIAKVDARTIKALNAVHAVIGA